MNYIIVNKIFISGRDLFHDLARSRNSYFFLSLDEILQTAMRAELQNQKIVFVGFGCVKTLNHILMFEISMDGNLLLKHFQRVALEFGQVDHLDGISFLRFAYFGAFIYFSAVTFA